MTELKDVIHYYIGCEVIIDGKERGRLMGANPIPNSVGQVYWDIITEEMKKEDEDFCMPYNDDPDMGPLRIKPILKLLEDVSDAQWNIISIKCVNHGRGKFVKDSFMSKSHDDRYFWTIVNKCLIQLRKMGVDCDNLIETDQAIDAKTINK